MNTVEKKVKHIEMIEDVIERMAKNSFQLKGWTMSLIALVGAISAQGSDKRFILLAFIPIIGFWLLDAYYLQQERKYKQLYKNVIEKEENQIDFSLDTSMVIGTHKEMKRLCFYRCFFSITELFFYPLIAAALIILVIVLKIF